MSKSISAGLLADIRADVTTLATAIELKRQDGRIFRLTSHDADLLIDGNNYDHTIPYNLSAVNSGTSLTTDNTELALVADGTSFIRAEFEGGLFNHAEVRIFTVDYLALGDGIMTLRQGWLGQMIINTNDIMIITVVGLLKVLDLQIGRVYQPSCDADLGDDRCKVALDDDQSQSSVNAIGLGDWVKVFDESQLTALTLTNAGFETAGVDDFDIVGWTQVSVNGGLLRWERVDGLPIIGNPRGEPTLVPQEGSFYLFAGSGVDPGDPLNDGSEEIIFQDVDISSQIGNATIDTGNIYVRMNSFYHSSFVPPQDQGKMILQFFNASGVQISEKDSRYFIPGTGEIWREKTISVRVPALSRTMRISLGARREIGIIYNFSFDDVRCWFWDVSVTDPTDGLVYKAARLATFDNAASGILFPINSLFEIDADVTNTNTNGSITGWTQAVGDFWEVLSAISGGGLSAFAGRSLFGGDDSSGTQSTYTVTQTLLTSTLGLDNGSIDLGQYIFRFEGQMGFADTGLSAGRITIDFNDNVSALISTVNTGFDTGVAGAYGLQQLDAAVPVGCREIVITLEARSPIGISKAGIGYDDLKFWIYNADEFEPSDPVAASGSASTVFSQVVGGFTIDGNIIWKALDTFIKFDVVASVVDRKEFIGTAIAGGVGAFETATIEWITGNNAGTKNIIRQWNTATTGIKMYFQSLNDIQVGDRYRFTTPCQKRFTEDCQIIFDNVINFRGFPFLPGKLDG